MEAINMNLPLLPLTYNFDTATYDLLVSSSFLDWVQTCPLGSSYYKLFSKVGNKQQAALIFGGHLHTVFEHFYRQKEYNTPIELVTQQAQQILEQEFLARPTPEDDFRSLNWAIEVYQQWQKRTANDDFSLLKYKKPKTCKYCKPEQPEKCLWCNDTGFSSIMAEVPFKVKLFTYDNSQTKILVNNSPPPSFDIYYHGFIDLPVVMRNQIFTRDYKSTVMLGSGFWDDKRASTQQKGYCWAWNKTMVDLPATGFNVSGIRVTQPPQYVTNGTASRKGEFKTIEEWWNESIVEQSFFIGEGELDEWLRDAICHVEEFLWHYSRGYFPKKPSMHCVHKYGRCDFYEMCWTFPIEERIHLLNSEMFRTKEINPQLVDKETDD